MINGQPARDNFRMYEPPQSRRDLALEAGYDPNPGDDCTPLRSAAEYDALPFDHPSKARNAQWAHQGAPDPGCKDCGTRCERCGDRMCDRWGPAPQAGCRETCVDCPQCPCLACHEARWESLLERDAQVSRDGDVA